MQNKEVLERQMNSNPILNETPKSDCGLCAGGKFSIDSPTLYVREPASEENLLPTINGKSFK